MKYDARTIVLQFSQYICIILILFFSGSKMYSNRYVEEFSIIFISGILSYGLFYLVALHLKRNRSVLPLWVP